MEAFYWQAKQQMNVDVRIDMINTKFH